MSKPKQIGDALQKVRGTYDPAVERHKDELFGTPVAADPTPVDDRNAGPGREYLEWIGEFGPLAQAKLAAAVELKLVPREVAEAWVILNEGATTRIPGISHHTMSVARDGMSEDYTWGPYEYVIAVKRVDIDRILSGSMGHQFRIIGYQGKQPADYDPIERYTERAIEKDLITTDTVDKIRRIVTEEDPPEKLTGVVAQAGRRLGTWTPTR
jgi:hypothetical protein